MIIYVTLTACVRMPVLVGWSEVYDAARVDRVPHRGKLNRHYYCSLLFVWQLRSVEFLGSEKVTARARVVGFEFREAGQWSPFDGATPARFFRAMRTCFLLLLATVFSKAVARFASATEQCSEGRILFMFVILPL